MCLDRKFSPQGKGNYLLLTDRYPISRNKNQPGKVNIHFQREKVDKCLVGKDYYIYHHLKCNLSVLVHYMFKI
jgi:hypothetical protein